MHTIWTRSFTAWPSALLLRFGGVGGSGDSVAVRAANLLLTWQQRASERHALASLEAHMLSDIGLSRADAWREAAKPFWRA